MSTRYIKEEDSNEKLANSGKGKTLFSSRRPVVKRASLTGFSRVSFFSFYSRSPNLLSSFVPASQRTKQCSRVHEMAMKGKKWERNSNTRHGQLRQAFICLARAHNALRALPHWGVTHTQRKKNESMIELEKHVRSTRVQAAQRAPKARTSKQKARMGRRGEGAANARTKMKHCWYSSQGVFPFVPSAWPKSLAIPG